MDLQVSGGLLGEARRSAGAEDVDGVREICMCDSDGVMQEGAEDSFTAELRDGVE